MAAYVIFDVVVTDPEGFAAYPPLAGPTVAHYGGRFLAGPGHSATLEGDWAPRGLVVLEFPSADRARAWWDSAEYGPAKAIRQRSATSNVVLVEGAPG